jgi:tRNA A37 threonylcarbamoyladenosine modification protein TsaB
MRVKQKMRLKCPECKRKAVIYSHSCSKEEISNAYAKCTNESCIKYGHSFSTQIAFTGWIEPKAAAMQQSLELMFQHLPEDAKKDFLASASDSISSAA